MANANGLRNGLSAYRRDDHEEMQAGPPMDLSFKKATSMNDFDLQRARSIRVGKVPLHTSSQRFLTSSLWLSNNLLSSMSGLENLVNRILVEPSSLAWLDLSFNNISEIDDEITKFPNLKIIYMHGNAISNLNTVPKLRKLCKLRNLTLHGNPIESVPSYRSFILTVLPQLVNLDFAPVVAAERKKAPPAGFSKMMNA
ncbi:leucine-rich repeat-containing protein 51-like [Neodiprion fabricii]|uniref:leucine-rich repeat-containing protein 51-like n=1 Tax=Neodiprion fabricii TaxID=2872261 RepID=UPI001ED92CCE|nr:leucine-rich repeat-containing protein 51-like [Neodiprion fabricii]